MRSNSIRGEEQDRQLYWQAIMAEKHPENESKHYHGADIFNEQFT